MTAPSSTPDATRPRAKLGTAAVADYLDHREFGSRRRLPSDAERDMIQDAIEGFVTYEQWLALEHDDAELVASLRGAADGADLEATVARDLLGQAADALTELGQRLSLQRHSREIMYEGLVLESEGLKQARLAAGRAAKQAKIPSVSRATKMEPSALPNAAELSLYQVKFWRRSVTADRMSIEVAAANEKDARARVAAWGIGELELTEREEASEALEREELQESSFEDLLDLDEAYAVTLIGSADLS